VKLGEQTGKITKTLHSLPFRSKPGVDAAVDEVEQEKKLTVPDALAQLQKRIDSFQKEVDMCERERLGEVAKNTANIESGLVFIANQNVGEYRSPQLLPASTSSASSSSSLIFFQPQLSAGPYVTRANFCSIEKDHRYFHEAARGDVLRGDVHRELREDS
jgi:hypothetical protein